jgi:hypothetical protein
MSVQDLLSYSRTRVLCSGQSQTKDAASLEEQIAQQLMPVISLFSTEYVTAAVCSSPPQLLFKQDKDVSLQTTLKPRRYSSQFLFSLRCRMRRRWRVALRLVSCIPILNHSLQRFWSWTVQPEHIPLQPCFRGMVEDPIVWISGTQRTTHWGPVSPSRSCWMYESERSGWKAEMFDPKSTKRCVES